MFVIVLASLAVVAWSGARSSAQPAGATEPSGVSFSVAGGVYSSNVTVALSAQPPSATIHYTLNGSDPNEQAPSYSTPIQITNSIVIKARAFESGKPGDVFCESYTRLDPSAAEFSSNLPLVIINTYGREITRDLKTSASVRIIDPGKGRATLMGTADVDSRALVKLRGHSSLRYPKRSYKLKLCDAENHPFKASVLGMPKESEWVLYAPYPDRTLMRDVLAYELSNQMGRYAPRTRFVEVFVNRAGGLLAQRQYMGVFVLEENIKRSKHRVPIAKLDREDNTEPAVTGGYLFKKDHLDHSDPGPANIGGFPNAGGPAPGASREGFPTGPGGFPGDPHGFLPTQGQGDSGSSLSVSRDDRMNSGEGFTSPHGSQLLYVEPNAEEITSAQRRWLSQYIRRFETALYGPEFRDPVKGYAAYLDVDSFIDHHWIVEATKNIDGFRFSTFFHIDRGGKLKAGPIWDWNLSFGAANGKQGYTAEYWYWPQLDDQQYSWYRRLFEDPDFAQKYVDRWGELRTNQLATTKLIGRIDELAAFLNEAQARNYKRWKILGRQVWPDYYTGKTYADEVQYMKNWVVHRLSWLDRQFLTGPTFSWQGGTGGPDSKLVMRSGVGKIYYTLDGSDPRAPGGALSVRAQQYRSPLKLAAVGEGVVTARVLEGSRWSWPSRAQLSSNLPKQ
jgi:hypothetical protein